MTAIDGWEILDRKNREESDFKYRSHPNYEKAVKEAEERGFKPAPLWMLTSPAYNDVIFKWRGGCWVRLDYDTGE